MTTRFISGPLGLTIAAAFVLAGTRLLPAGEKLRVIGERVNLRSGPASETKVVTQVSRGDLVESLGRETNGWAAVAPPQQADVWVYGELVKDGVTTVPNLHVRAGPGINYQTVGRLDTGAKVNIREEWQGWLKIAPPPGCVVWISTNYVEEATDESAATTRPRYAAAGADGVASAVADEGQGAREGGAVSNVQKPPMPASMTRTVQRSSVAAPAVVPQAEEPPTPAGIPSVLADKELVAGVVQGKSITHTGYLAPSGWVWRRPSKFRLLEEDSKGRSSTACYVLGNEAQLSGLQGQKVVIHGREYWIQGVRYSVVIPDRLVIPDSP